MVEKALATTGGEVLTIIFVIMWRSGQDAACHNTAHYNIGENMKTRNLASVLSILLISISMHTYASECTADVENTGSKLVGNRFFTSWRVRHDAGKSRLATVYFEYKIHYTNKRGATLVERGVFRRLVRGQGKQYTKENLSVHDPVDIISVDYDKIHCSD